MWCVLVMTRQTDRQTDSHWWLGRILRFLGIHCSSWNNVSVGLLLTYPVICCLRESERPASSSFHGISARPDFAARHLFRSNPDKKAPLQASFKGHRMSYWLLCRSEWEAELNLPDCISPPYGWATKDKPSQDDIMREDCFVWKNLVHAASCKEGFG